MQQFLPALLSHQAETLLLEDAKWQVEYLLDYIFEENMFSFPFLLFYDILNQPTHTLASHFSPADFVV
jgi:hypothetical protein